MRIRRATAEDIPLMRSLASASMTAAQWSEKHYADLLTSSSRLALVAEEAAGEAPGKPASFGETSSVLGFLVARHLAPEWELENIVVAPDVRRKGIGQRLLDALLSAAHETNSEAVFLEVRESNPAARALYERAGFKQKGRRKSYYSNPVEDAILYRRSAH